MTSVRGLVRRLNPFLTLFGPIFQKEVRSAGRRKGTYIFRGVYAVVLLILACVAFLAISSDSNELSAVVRLQRLQGLAPELTAVLAGAQLAILFFAAPLLAAGSICDERRARSLDVLLTTPMTATQIVWGKLSSRLVQLVILTLLSTPVLLSVRIFGGLNAEVVIAAECLALSTAILGAALAILFSIRQRRATVAALFAVLSLTLIQCGPAMVEGVRFQAMNPFSVETPFHEQVLATCAPWVQFSLGTASAAGRGVPHLLLFEPPQYSPGMVVKVPARVPLDLGPTWMLCSIYNLLAALCVALYTSRVLRKAMARAARGGLLLGEAAPATVESDESIETQAPSERFRRRDRNVKDNPVLWREVRQPLYGSKWITRIVVVLAVTCLAVLYATVGLANAGLHLSLAIVGGIAVMFQAVFMTTGGYAGEREARTWDVLLTTSLSAGQIIRGKLIGAMRSFWFIPVIVIAHFSIAALLGYVRPVAPVMLALIYAGPILFFTAFGQLFSLRFRRAVVAGGLNLLLAVSVWILIWPGMLFALWLLRSIESVVGGTFTDDLLDRHVWTITCAVAFSNPIVAIAVLVEPALGEQGSRGIVFQPYAAQLPAVDSVFSLLEAALEVAAIFGVYVAGGALAMLMARLKFRRYSGRTS